MRHSSERQKAVRPGQCYRARTRWARTLQVVAVVPDVSGVPHAKLHGVDDPLERRTVSCHTLLDRRLWERLADAPGLSIAAE